jgi:hypothetical protein
MVPKIKKVEFGNIHIDNEVFSKEDFFLFWDSVEPTEKTHKPGIEELESMLLKEPDTIIFGIGFRSLVKINEAIIKTAKTNKVELIILPTPEALKKFQELIKKGKKVAARIHTTC